MKITSLFCHYKSANNVKSAYDFPLINEKVAINAF